MLFRSPTLCDPMNRSTRGKRRRGRQRMRWLDGRHLYPVPYIQRLPRPHLLSSILYTISQWDVFSTPLPFFLCAQNVVHAHHAPGLSCWPPSEQGWPTERCRRWLAGEEAGMFLPHAFCFLQWQLCPFILTATLSLHSFRAHWGLVYVLAFLSLSVRAR